jgi:hypothetical protein
MVLHRLAVDEVLNGVFLADDRKHVLPDARDGNDLNDEFGVQVFLDLLLREGCHDFFVADFQIGAVGAEVEIFFPRDPPFFVVLQNRVDNRVSRKSRGGYPDGAFRGNGLLQIVGENSLN